VAGSPCLGKSSGTESLCEPFRTVIEKKLQQGLTGQRIYQDLVEGHRFAASYSSLRRFIQHLDQSEPIPFRRLEVLPGEQVPAMAVPTSFCVCSRQSGWPGLGRKSTQMRTGLGGKMTVK
jgi:hypothetical protein